MWGIGQFVGRGQGVSGFLLCIAFLPLCMVIICATNHDTSDVPLISPADCISLFAAPQYSHRKDMTMTSRKYGIEVSMSRVTPYW